MRWSEVDGVNVAWSEEPGPLRASLVFRIGKADERLAVNGITHLIEHLALFPLGQQPHYQNGAVRTSLTSFDTAGDPSEVSAFLSGVREPGCAPRRPVGHGATGGRDGGEPSARRHVHPSARLALRSQRSRSVVGRGVRTPDRRRGGAAVVGGPGVHP